MAPMQLQGTANAVDRDMSECTNVVSSDLLLNSGPEYFIQRIAIAMSNVQ